MLSTARTVEKWRQYWFVDRDGQRVRRFERAGLPDSCGMKETSHHDPSGLEAREGRAVLYLLRGNRPEPLIILAPHHRYSLLSKQLT
jgi:hypothetical protein